MRILWLKTELLHPVDKGGRIRTYQMLRYLKRNHHVTYLTLDDGAAAPDALSRASEYSHEVITVPHRTAAKGSPRFYAELAGNSFSSDPYAIAKYRSAGMRGAIVRTADTDVVVCDFLAPAVNLPERLAVPVLLFQHNVEAVIWRRHADVRTNPIAKAFFYRQWQRMSRFERDVCRRVDGIVTVSASDTETIQRDYGVAALGDVPTGVDTDYFRPADPHVRESGHIVFTGSMDWLPNDDAMRHFLSDIFPHIRQRVPSARLTVVGRSPSSWLRAQADRDPAIEVTGRVDDVRPYIERASCYVVPIRIGGGTRLKIYEGMAMGCPIVSTTVGAEGLPLLPDHEILIADAPEHFAAQVVHVLSDPAFASALGGRGAHRVRTDFAWPRVADRFSELCERVAASSTDRQPARAVR